MKVTRRKFLKLSGSAVAVAAVSSSAIAAGESLFNLDPARKYAAKLKTRYAHESTTICPYCGVGCGIIVSTYSGKVLNTEGNPDHPINEGALCSKGNAVYQIANNHRRMDKVLYRAPGASAWEEKSWDFAIKRIAENIKSVRDKHFITDSDGKKVNRVEAVASLGGAALDNEECYLWRKIATTLGLVFIEHQARI